MRDRIPHWLGRPRLGGRFGGRGPERLTKAGRQGVERAAAAGTAAAGAIGSAAGWTAERWRRTPTVIKRRLAALAIVAVAVALFALVIVPNAPCQFPGGSTCPPDDDLIEMVPDAALGYVHVNVEPGDEQFEAARQLAGELPQLALDLGGALPTLPSLLVDYEERIAPWAGGELAAVVIPDGLDSAQAAMVEVVDPEAARTYAAAQLGRQPATSTLSGIEITTDADDFSWALIEGVLVLGDRPVVGQFVRVAAGEVDSLADAGVATGLLDELPDRNVLSAYASEPGLELAERTGALGGFDSFVDSSASVGLAATISVEEGELALSSVSELDPELVESSANVLTKLPDFEPEVTDEIGADALAVAVVGDAQASVARLLEQAASAAPGLLRGLRSFNRRLGRGPGPGVDQRLLGLLGAETALTVQPQATEGSEEGREGQQSESPRVEAPTQPPYLGLIARDVDTESAQRTLAELQGPIADAVDASAGQAPTFEAGEVEGVETQALRISPAVELVYGFVEGTLVAGSSPVAIERFASDLPSLSDADGYEEVTDELPDQLGMLLYLDVAGLLALGEAVGLATDPAFALRAPELRRLERAALAIDPSRERLRTELRISLGDPAPEPELEPEIETEALP